MVNTKFRELRESVGLTPTELAYHTGLSVSAISRYERYSRKPSYENAKKLAQVLNVDIETIYDSFTLTELEQKGK